MGSLQDATTIKPAVLPTATQKHVFLSALRYLLGKALTIAMTIFVGVFTTMLIVNYPIGDAHQPPSSQFQLRLEQQIQTVINVAIFRGKIHRGPDGLPVQAEVDALEERLRKDAGLDLPFLPKYLSWTIKVLSFDWGELNSDVLPQLGLGQGLRNNPAANNTILDYLPNTLLLVGTAYLLVFLIGMPFALYLARHHGNKVDQLMSILSPVSSVPGWVFGMLLVTIFAVQLRWLPPADMFDFHRPTEPIPYILVVAKHMILPVSALVLSLLFQLVYTWRTFLIIYSEEDYVELARAKGLETRWLEKQYILRPALPYLITSFATSLILFWQLTVALEKVFHWPGIGLLYLKALPNYWGENIEIGDLMIVVQIVVTFAYLLGILVFLLDLAYVLVDPRIHLIPASHLAQTSARLKKRGQQGRGLSDWVKERAAGPAQPLAGHPQERTFSRERFISNTRESLREMRERIALFVEQLRIYPSAIFGLVIITLLIVGSLYALIALPYEEIGMDFDQNRSTGRNYVPRTAAPIWTDFFSVPPRLSSLILEERSSGASISTRNLENGWIEKTVTIPFDYSYKELPTDVFLYLDADYEEKLPFVSLEWNTPDGRTIELKSKAMSSGGNYDLWEGVPIRNLLNEHPAWKNWFVTDGQYPTPAYQLLLADPHSSEPVPLHGRYQLKVTSLLFEAESNIRPQLVLLGQVYGMAGTDYWRRDLLVPLFWGMPFTLMVGFWGTLITTLIALLLPAVGVWYGGWLDSFIQRLTEINMVLPGLAVAVLFNALFGVHIWIILGIVVVLNALGAPIKSFRSALLQAKEAPYIEMARSYGASDSRIITRYLVPRILPVLIPHLVMQIPTFIFLEATLGFFNIKSIYPSWGRIIYEGLARGALYGSPFWVLEPIFLLLLTGLAFALVGLALERILNPRVISDMPARSKPRQKADKVESHRNTRLQAALNWKVLTGLLLALLAILIFTPVAQGKTLAIVLMSYFDLSQKPSPKNSGLSVPNTPQTVIEIDLTGTPLIPVRPSSTVTPTASPTLFPTASATQTQFVQEPTQTPAPLPTGSRSTTYTLQSGEYPYCIARRFNVDPGELLALNGMLNRGTFFAGMVLQIPQTGNPFPGERMQKAHPAPYTVSRADETMYAIACQFGDVDPATIAQANGISIDSVLYIGQQLKIP